MSLHASLYLALALALASLPHESSSAATRLQFSVPKDIFYDDGDDALPKEDQDRRHLLQDFFETPNTAEEQLRTALRSLLELNDGELKALLKGVPVSKVKDRMSPSTEFFLKASRSRLERIRTMLSEHQQEDLKLKGDFEIAKRSRTADEELGTPDEGTDAGSLLGALTELSKSVTKEKRRAKKAQRKHKRHSYHTSSSQERNIHYSYWLKPEECPLSAEGGPRVHCPSRSETGAWLCVEDYELCDGHSHCPNHEDEEPRACLFFKSMQNYVELLFNAVVASARS